jgi:hypothetical protein
MGMTSMSALTKEIETLYKWLIYLKKDTEKLNSVLV